MRTVEMTVTLRAEVDVDDDFWASLLELGGTSTSEPQGNGQVSRRRRRESSGRAAAGARLPESQYRLPLLEVLAERGGSATLREATDAVGEKLKNQLRPIDFERVPSGRGVRWRNRVQWVRSHMTREGLLRSDSPRGVWELSDTGWQELQRSGRSGTSSRGRRS